MMEWQYSTVVGRAVNQFGMPVLTAAAVHPSQSGSCPYPVGTKGVLSLSTHAAPVISESVYISDSHPLSQHSTTCNYNNCRGPPPPSQMTHLYPAVLAYQFEQWIPLHIVPLQVKIVTATTFQFPIHSYRLDSQHGIDIISDNYIPSHALVSSTSNIYLIHPFSTNLALVGIYTPTSSLSTL